MQQVVNALAPACDPPYFLAAWLRHRCYLPTNQLLQPHHRLREDRLLDYLAFLELVGDAETYYEVLLPDALLDAWQTVQDLEDTLRQVAAKAGHPFFTR